MDVSLPIWAAAIIAVLGAAGGLSGLAALWNSRTKAKSSTVDNLQALVTVLNKEIGRLQKRIGTLEDESDTQREKIHILEDKVDHWRDKYEQLECWVRNKLGMEPFEDVDSE